MKRVLCIAIVPMLLLVYFFSGAVYRFDDVFTYFIPFEWDTIMRYRILAILNIWFYTLYCPFLSIFDSDILLASDPTILMSYQALCNQAPYYEQICVILSCTFLVFSILVLVSFQILARNKYSECTLLYIPLVISIGYGVIWILLLNDVECVFAFFLLYLIFGMFWGCVSQGTFYLLERRRKNENS